MAICKNQVVSIEYEVKDASNGELIDSNLEGDPLEFMMGSGHVIAGLEEEIAQMSGGESKQVLIPAAKAYGGYDETAVEDVEIEQFAGIELAEGMTLYGQSESGQTVQVRVKKIAQDKVTIDYNHPLAGKDLSFSVKILNLRDATEEEIAHGGLFHECGCGAEDGECCGGTEDGGCCEGGGHGAGHACGHH